MRLPSTTELGPNVDVDANHPLAGEVLTFDVEITAIRDTTAEEKSHGHVHGPGGVQHWLRKRVSISRESRSSAPCTHDETSGVLLCLLLLS